MFMPASQQLQTKKMSNYEATKLMNKTNEHRNKEMNKVSAQRKWVLWVQKKYKSIVSNRYKQSVDRSIHEQFEVHETWGLIYKTS